MHLHLPKPVHGWRSFAGEVGIIVLGVLIALAAGQWVEELGWRHKAEEAERAIRSELALDAGVFDDRGMTNSCTKEQLNEIDTIIRKARHTGQIGNVGPILGGGSSLVVTSAWDSTLAEGTTSHIPPKRRQMYAILYPMLVTYIRDLDEENRLWAHLRLLQNNPGRMSDALLADVAASRVELGYRAALVNVLAAQALIMIKGLGIKPDYGFLTGSPGTLGHGTRLDVEKGLRTAGLAEHHCAPLIVDGKPLTAEQQPRSN